MSPLLQIANFFNVPEELLIALLLLPTVLLIIVAMRHLLGLRGMGIIPPLMIGYALIAMPFPFGLIFLLIIAGFSLLAMKALRDVPLLAQPRLALIQSGLLILTFILLITGTGSQTLKPDALLYPILLILFTSEWFSKAELRRSQRSGLILSIQVLTAGFASYLWLAWPVSTELVRFYPWQVVIISIILIALLGRWRGLRLTEYVRFKPIIEHYSKRRHSSQHE